MKRLYLGIAATFLMGSALAVPVVLELTTDTFGQETSFEIAMMLDGVSIAYDSFTTDSGMDESGLLGDGFVDFFDLLDFTFYTFTWDLGAGDYIFTIFDSFGDFNGEYTLLVDGVNIGGGNQNFGLEETIDFSVPEPGTLLLFGLGLAGLALSRRRRIV